MLIIAGHLTVDPAERDRYVEECSAVVRAAREARGCLDFSITADTVDPGQVRIYERWTDETDLLEFRGSGPSGDQQAAAILGAEVKRYSIDAVGDA